MINHEKLELVANAYCDHFDHWWEHEEHKLRALKQFKEHWDLGCEDFVAMYQLSTQYADQLLIASRIDAFTNTIRILLNQFAVDNPNWALNIKQSQSISSYLYFAYPERYYVYQKELVAKFASFLDCPLKLADSLKGSDLVSIFEFFDQVKDYIQNHHELLNKGQALFDSHGLKISALNLIAWDLSCFYARSYDQQQLNICRNSDIIGLGQQTQP